MSEDNPFAAPVQVNAHGLDTTSRTDGLVDLARINPFDMNELVPVPEGQDARFASIFTQIHDLRFFINRLNERINQVDKKPLVDDPALMRRARSLYIIAGSALSISLLAIIMLIVGFFQIRTIRTSYDALKESQDKLVHSTSWAEDPTAATSEGFRLDCDYRWTVPMPVPVSGFDQRYPYVFSASLVQPTVLTARMYGGNPSAGKWVWIDADSKRYLGYEGIQANEVKYKISNIKLERRCPS